MSKEFHYKILSNSGNQEKTLGELWLSDGKVVTHPSNFIHVLESLPLQPKSEDGVNFIRAVLQHYKSGYLSVKRVDEA